MSPGTVCRGSRSVGQVISTDNTTENVAARVHSWRRNRPAIRRLDLAFHEEVCRGSGNDRLLDVFHRYVPALHTLLAYDELVYASLDAIVEQHQAIYDAIRSGEPDAAAAAVATHCDVARDQVSAHFESTPEPSS